MWEDCTYKPFTKYVILVLDIGVVLAAQGMSWAGYSLGQYNQYM